MLKTFYSGYGDLTRLQDELVHRGNVALKDYPLIDRIKRILDEFRKVTPQLIDLIGA